MANNYQHARNDHANGTKAKKYIQQYKYKKSSLKTETTEKERWQKIPRTHFVLSAIQIPRIT